MPSMVEMRPAGEPARDWRDRGSCLEEDPELFFPDGKSSPAVLEQVAEAKLVCSGCPVLLQCREWALATREPYGVWGGLDEDERAEVWAAEARRDRQARQARRADRGRAA